MRDYELVYIVNPQLVDENLTGVVEKVSQFISSRGGQIGRVDAWGRRRLAYPIATFREGTYILTEFKMDPSQAPDLESSLRTSEEIIRHLMIRLDEAQIRHRQQQREEAERAQREQAAAREAAAQAAAQAAAAQAAAQEAAAQAAAQEAAAQAAAQEAAAQAAAQEAAAQAAAQEAAAQAAAQEAAAQAQPVESAPESEQPASEGSPETS